jgi:tetratricopeptide (TPR) repeat protein
MSRLAILAMVVASVLASGCQKKEAQNIEADLRDLFGRADACMMAGDTNGALTLFESALKDPRYAKERGWLFSCCLQTMLMMDRLEEVKTRYLEIVGRDEELTRAGFGILYDAVSRTGDEAALDGWIAKMNEVSLPQDLAAQAFGWRLSRLRTLGRTEELIAQVRPCIDRFDAQTARRLLEEAVGADIGAGEYDRAEKLLAEIEKLAGSKPELRSLVLTQKGNILFRREQWKEAEEHFIRSAPALPDGELAGWFSHVASVASGKQQYDVVDRLCMFIFKQQKDKPGAIRTAAYRWIDVARARKATAEIPSRLKALQSEGISPDLLYSLYRNEFYNIAAETNTEAVAAMAAFGETLVPNIKAEEDIGLLKTMALDASFLVGDYAKSIQILEAGIPGKDKAWHDMALIKARAHLALKENKPREAVEFFRRFMEIVKTWEKGEQDPCTGIVYSKEMCLGFNAKRIGDILKSDGDEAGAKAAYAESRTYYEKALADAKKGSEEEQVILKDMESLPKTD